LESETDSRISSRSSSLGSVRNYPQRGEIILRQKLLSPKNASQLGSPRESVDKKFITALNQKEVRFILPEDHNEKEEKTSNTKLFMHFTQLAYSTAYRL
jgi:hypothetical protein